MYIKDNARILFVGDSITDAGRDRNDVHSLSTFSYKIAAYINAAYPFKNIEIFNRAISGARSCDLDRDIAGYLADTKPDYVVMLIGINDTWRAFFNEPTSAAMYEKNMRSIFGKIKAAGAKLIVMEPFLTSVDPIKVRDFYVDLIDKINALRRICRETADCEYIPLDGIFAAYEIEHKGADITSDGAHPTEFGSTIIANEILSRLTF